MQPLTPISIPNGTRKVDFRRPGSSKTAPRLTSNAFKNLPFAINTLGSDDLENLPSSPLASSATAVAALPLPPTAAAATAVAAVTIAPASTTAAIAVAPAAATATTAVAPVPATVTAATVALVPSTVPAAPATFVVTADDGYKDPQYRVGAQPVARKPKAADYKDEVTALIIRAAFEYEALVSTTNFFPDTALRTKWAQDTWKSAGEAAELKYKLISDISLLVMLIFFFEGPLLTSFFSSSAREARGFVVMPSPLFACASKLFLDSRTRQMY